MGRGTTTDHRPLQINEEQGITVRLDRRLGQHRKQHLAHQVGLQLCQPGRLAILLAGLQGHTVDALRPAISVFDPDLSLGIGQQIRQRLLQGLGIQDLSDPVRQRDRQRHQRLGLIAGVAEYRRLILDRKATELLIIHRVQIERVIVAITMIHEAGHDGAGIGIEDIGRVADAANHLAGDIGDGDPGFGRIVRRDEEHTARDRALGIDSRISIEPQHMIDDGIADLITELVRVSCSHRLRGEDEIVAHGHTEKRFGV